MIVISDMMGTLTTGSPFLGLVDWVKHNQSKFRANMYLAAVMPSYILAKTGLIDWQKWGQNLMIKSLAYIHNANEDKLSDASEWVVEHDLWKKRRKDMIERLVEHHRKWRKCVHCQQRSGTFCQAFCQSDQCQGNWDTH